MFELGTKNQDFGTKEYWEKRYEKEELLSFDWFKGFQELRILFENLIANKSGKVLQLGCGNSLMSHELYRHGWKNIVNVDYSETVIKSMIKKSISMPDMEWVVTDILRLNDSFEPETFDYAIDKGTLDALLTEKHDPWNPEQELIAKIKIYLTQIAQSLKPNGKLIHITYSQPHFRTIFLNLVKSFKIIVHKLKEDSDAFDYFVYECIKIP